MQQRKQRNMEKVFKESHQDLKIKIGEEKRQRERMIQKQPRSQVMKRH